MKKTMLNTVLASALISTCILTSGLAHAGAVNSAARIALDRSRAMASAAAEAARLQRQAQAASAAAASRRSIAAAETARHNFAVTETARRNLAVSNMQARIANASAQNAARMQHGAAIVRMRSTPQIANDLGRVKAGTQRELLSKNGISGRVAELNAANQLQAQGYKILGSQVSVRTPKGLRRVDHVVQAPDGRLFATEVKWGNASRSSAQISKDTAMSTSGGTFVGKNAPAEWHGKQAQLPTLIMQY